MNYPLALLAAITLSTAPLHAQTTPPPEPPPGARDLIGDYVAGDRVVYVTEVAGQLKVRTGLFSSRLFDSPGMRRAAGVLWIGDQRFVRRDAAHGTFRITPLRAVEELRPEALAATPPAQPDTLRAPDLVELRTLEPGIKYDIRYATTNNFMSAVFYSQAKAFLQRPAAEAVVRAHRELNKLGYGLLIHDAYRPWYVTKMFWDATPDSLRDFVADPRFGSRHNRGAAVDLTLYDLKTGQPVEMPSGYDEFSVRAYPEYPGGTTRQRWHRDLLRRVMEAEGFRVYNVEWWHFDYQDWRWYPVLNRRFEDIG
ncbi:MAG TPA: M15 family metallopeptidase [Longimicrobiales bacterium]|nr:M15 family metallopeptidase [Longimicrobiales bacterium]